MRKTTAVLFFSLLTAVLSGCSSPGVNTANSDTTGTAGNAHQASQTANFNIEELGMLVTLAVEPDEVAWKETAPSNQPKRLTAVLKYSSPNADRVTELASRHRPAALETMATEPWYPAELIAQSETSGETAIRGHSYAAGDFFLPPYSDGKLTRVENTNFFILELYAR